MFFDIFYDLCKENGVSCKRAAEEIGLSNSITTKWKKTGATPNTDTLNKIAKYFNVSVDYLAGNVTDPFFRVDNAGTLADINSYYNEETPALTKKDERDIARILEQTMAQLENSGDLMFDGDPMSDEARESIRSALKLGLEAAKLKNKETYTPKKYRKG